MRRLPAPTRRWLLGEVALLTAITGGVFVALYFFGASKPPPHAERLPAFSQSTEDRVIVSHFADDRLIVRTALRELPHPITDPTDSKTIYRYQSTGYARAKASTESQTPMRFVVYAEDQPGLTDAAKVCGFMLRLWDMLSSRLGMDHPLAYQRIVYVFLKKTGKPGAEQKITTGPDEHGQQLKRDSIFIYDIASLTDQMEFCRELAHEYGHAVLPAVGGLKEPEYWVNGCAGEHLFLSWLLQEMAAARITSRDVFDLKQSVLEEWVRKNNDPLAQSVLDQGLDPSLLKGDGDAAMNAYLGLLLATDTLYGDAILARGMLLANGNALSNVELGIAHAIAEKSSISITPSRTGDPFWAYLPGTKWSVIGGTVAGSRPGGWVRIKAAPGAKVTAKHEAESN